MKDTEANLEFELLKYKLSNEVLVSELGELNNRFNEMQKTFNELINQFPQQSQS